MKTKTNAERFITAYNRLDKTIRDIYNFKPALTFSDVIRKSADMNYLIKKYEDDLIDYGRLRNSIVHRSDDHVIAEPHDEVVEQMEKIVRVVTMPPQVMQTVANRSVFIADGNVSCDRVLVEMSKNGFSNVPIYLGGTLVGVLNRKMVVDAIGAALLEQKDIDALLKGPIVDCFSVLDVNNHYEVVGANVTIDNILFMFQQNRKLSTIVITPNGTYNEFPVGIIVTADLIDIQAILDNY